MSDVANIKEYLEWRGTHEGRERDVSPEEWDHQQAVKEVVQQAGFMVEMLASGYTPTYEELCYAVEWYWKTVPSEGISGAITGGE